MEAALDGGDRWMKGSGLGWGDGKVDGGVAMWWMEGGAGWGVGLDGGVRAGLDGAPWRRR